MTDKKPKGIEEGPPMYVESLLNVADYAELRKRYNTYSVNFTLWPPHTYKADLKWRYKMGTPFTPEDIKLTNKQAAELHQKLREYHGHKTVSPTVNSPS